MALFSECRLKCAQNTLDIADIVREGFNTNWPTSGVYHRQRKHSAKEFEADNWESAMKRAAVVLLCLASCSLLEEPENSTKNTAY
jgi:hypothetical protein